MAKHHYALSPGNLKVFLATDKTINTSLFIGCGDVFFPVTRFVLTKFCSSAKMIYFEYHESEDRIYFTRMVDNTVIKIG